MMINDYLKVFASDERFLVFAVFSLTLAVLIFHLSKGAGHFTRLLLMSGAFLTAFAFVILAPLSSLSIAAGNSNVSPVELYYNCGFFALGLGLFFQFRTQLRPSLIRVRSSSK